MLVAMMPRVHADGEGEGDETTDSHRRWNAVCLHGRPNSSVGSDRLPASIFVESLAESHLDALSIISVVHAPRQYSVEICLLL